MTTETESKSAELQEAVEGKKDLLRALGFILLAVVVVRSFLFEPFKIPSSSMVPTLRIGDHIFVSKFNYGLSLPFTKFEFVKWGVPQRGDVIVFLFPKDESLHYIKRVVGVPGDQIEFKGKDILVNGQKLERSGLTDEEKSFPKSDLNSLGGELFKESIGSVSHLVRYGTGPGQELSRVDQVETVPEDHFFVIGDNRDDSYDSRSWGVVPRSNIKGKAQMIWLSLDPDSAWGTMNKVRWNRCGTLIK